MAVMLQENSTSKTSRSTRRSALARAGQRDSEVRHRDRRTCRIGSTRSARRDGDQMLNQLLADTITHPRHVQEAPLAGLRPHLLPAPSALRQALRGAGRDWRTRSPSASSFWAASRSPWAATSPSSPRFPRPPRGREEVPVQISRLLEAHKIIMQDATTSPKPPTRPATTAPTTWSSPTFCGPMNCSPGSSASTWSRCR